LVQGSGAITVTGTGSVSSPYEVSASLNLAVIDSSTVDLSLTGDGSIATPWTIGASTNLQLAEITDVVTAGATTGQVLAKQAGGDYAFVAPTTAPAGTINLSSTGGLQGDGSGGNPLAIKLPGSSGLILDATGLRMSGGGAWTSYTSTLTATTTNPSIGNGAIDAAYSQQGKIVTFAIECSIGSTTTRGVGTWQFSLPVAPRASRYTAVAAAVTANGIADYTAVGRIQGAQRIERVLIATSAAANSLSHSMPASLPAGSLILISGTYEAV
jgi:hypothetical protein